MRIPLPISILLALVVPLIGWWLGTRRLDFLTPPSEAALSVIRQQTAAALPRAEILPPIVAPQAPPTPPAPSSPGPEKKPEAAVEIGDLNPNPGLSTYSELAPKGARHLIELASLLETAGESPRTLLAWERVLDATTPEPPQATAALAAIQRLRPTLPAWNSDPAKAIPIVIHASAGSKLEKPLKTSLEQAARSLEQASSGILKVTVTVATTRTKTKRSAPAVPATVALWLSGAAAKSPATETLSFAVTKPDTLQADILRRIFRLAGNHLQHQLSFPAIIAAAADEPPLHALEFHITRRHWEQFGRALNAPPAAP